jgi:hypothetical protein
MTTPLYIITYDYAFRDRNGIDPNDHRVTGTLDLDLDAHNRADIIRKIAIGDVLGVQRIYECRPADKDAFSYCLDITAEIATDVADLLHEEQQPVTHDLKNWLHEMHPAGVASTSAIADA